MYHCHKDASWIIVTFLYLALLQVIGIVLAIQTSNVKVKVLNDSKYIAALIYISSIVLITRAVAVFAVPNLLNVREAIFSGGIILISTAILSLVFIPKVNLTVFFQHLQYSNVTLYHFGVLCPHLFADGESYTRSKWRENI